LVSFDRPATDCMVVIVRTGWFGRDILYNAVLEYMSTDDPCFKPGPSFVHGVACLAVPNQCPLNGIRIRATGSQEEWLIISEITFETLMWEKSRWSGDVVVQTDGGLALALNLTVWTSFGTQSFQNIELAFNGNSDDFCWSSRAMFAGDCITAVHSGGSNLTIRSISVITGRQGRSSQEETGGEDFLEEGVVEVSETSAWDQETGRVECNWVKVADFRNGCAEGLIPAGFQVASFQIRCTGSQMNWLKIRHIQLRGGIEQLTVA